MSRRSWGHPGPWLLPVVVLIEAGLVVSGRLTLGSAALVIVALELLLALVAIRGAIAAARSLRASRAANRDPWMAAEEAFAQLLPRRVARMVLLEVRLLTTLAGRVCGRQGRAAGQTFSYHRPMSMLIWGAFVLVGVEGAVVEVVLSLALPRTAWPWIVLAVHVYGLLWLAGLQASLITRPHELTAGALHVRDGIFTEVVIPYTAITGARLAQQNNVGRSGLKISPTEQSAMLAYGNAGVALSLDPDQPIEVNGRTLGTPLTRLSISADRPRDLVQALQAIRSQPHAADRKARHG
jgi:hypothetical protein